MEVIQPIIQSLFTESSSWLLFQQSISKLFIAATSSSSITDLPSSISSSLDINIILCFIVILLSYFLSIIFNNYSFVDKSWSIIPVIYAWVFFMEVDSSSPGYYRCLIMTILVTIWGCRLTYNFYRKGGYQLANEDYRWEVVRSRMHPIFFQLLNITFIASFQHILLLWIIFPLFIAQQQSLSSSSLNMIDYIAIGSFLLFLLIETIADQQQWNYQTKKYELLNSLKSKSSSSSSSTVDLLSQLPSPYNKGYLTTGLFYYSRHPNFFSEMMIWWCYYLFTIACNYNNIIKNNDYYNYNNYINWTIFGTLSLTLLFQGSTPLTEEITLSKYQSYSNYQQTTSRLIPWFPSSSSSSSKKDKSQ